MLRAAAIPMLPPCSIKSFPSSRMQNLNGEEWLAASFIAKYSGDDIGSMREPGMSLEEITLGAFAACNSLRIFAYIPQMHKAASDKNGASAISYTTWSLFLLAHLSTVAYALVNQAEWWLAACFALNAACCIAIVAIVYGKRRRYLRRSQSLRTQPRSSRLESCDQWQPNPSLAAAALSLGLVKRRLPPCCALA